MKGSMLFILGAAVGVIGYFMADSKFDPFYSQIEAKDCQVFYAKQLNITEAEFAARIQQMHTNP